MFTGSPDGPRTKQRFGRNVNRVLGFLGSIQGWQGTKWYLKVSGSFSQFYAGGQNSGYRTMSKNTAVLPKKLGSTFSGLRPLYFDSSTSTSVVRIFVKSGLLIGRELQVEVKFWSNSSFFTGISIYQLNCTFYRNYIICPISCSRIRYLVLCLSDIFYFVTLIFMPYVYYILCMASYVKIAQFKYTNKWIILIYKIVFYTYWPSDAEFGRIYHFTDITRTFYNICASN